MSAELVLAAAIGGILFFLTFYFITRNRRVGGKDELTEENEDTVELRSAPQRKQDKATKSSKNGKAMKAKKDIKHIFNHPWLATSLKGHSANILDFDFSPNGKYLISCADDRTCFMWITKDFQIKEHKYIRTLVEFDHATHVKFSPDSKAFITSLSMENTIRIFKIGRKEDGSPAAGIPAGDFEQKMKPDINSIGIASSGKFIMTCHVDTTINIYDLKGEILHTLDTGHMYNNYGAVSPCGRFIASSGFTPDVKAWEVCFDRAGLFKEVKRAFELTGHKSGIYSFSFNSDSTRVATVSKDGTWKLWNINVEYQRGQDPQLLKTGIYEHRGRSLVALSPDSRVLAIAQYSSVAFYYAETGECAGEVNDIHSEPISSLEFDRNGRYLVTSGDRQLHVIHNVPGHRALVRELEGKLKTASTKAMKDRFVQEIQETRDILQAIRVPEE